VPERVSAVRAHGLGGQRGGDLILDHRVLYRCEQVVGFLQLQTQTVSGANASLVRVNTSRTTVWVSSSACSTNLHGDPHAALVPVAACAGRAGPVLVQLCGMRLQLNGPNDVGVVGRWPQGVIVSFNHSSGRVLPWTTMRWKFDTE